MHVSCDGAIWLALPVDLSPRNVGEYRRKLDSALQDRARAIQVDCNGLHMSTSTHIGLLWYTLEQCREHDSELRLHNVNDDLQRVLEVLNLDSCFDVSRDARRPSDGARRRSATAQPPFYDSVKLSRDGVLDGLNKFMEYLRPLPIPEVLATDLRLLYYEVAMNTKCHSGLGERDRIDVSMTVIDDRFVLTFMDRGSAFDPTLLRSPGSAVDMAIAGRTRGFGLRIVQALADRIAYERRNDNENILTIEKSWR